MNQEKFEKEIEKKHQEEKRREEEFETWRQLHPEQESPEGMLARKMDEFFNRFGCPTAFQMVIKFHKKMGITYDGPPRNLGVELWDQRINHLREEFRELHNGFMDENLEEMLDAMCDILYVVYGTAHLMGMDIDTAFRRVHGANMKKECHPFDGEKQGIFKPEGWTPPDLKDLV